MSFVDEATIEHHGDDLVISVHAKLSGYDKAVLAATSVLVVAGIPAAIAAWWWLSMPFGATALALTLILNAWVVIRMWPDLRWWISGSEEWRLAGTSLVYCLWHGDNVSVRRNLDLGQIGRLGTRRRPRQLTRWEFAVVDGTTDRLVGRGSLSPQVASRINDALREYLARPDMLHRAAVFAS